MANYQIKLTPVDTFFFGGEKHVEKDGKPETNYFVESNLYPQQTTLLGLLRYYLLLKKPSVFSNNKITDKTEAVKIIGEKSFDFSGKSNNFGKINQISPLYFSFENEIYFFGPLDFEFIVDNFQLFKKDKKSKIVNYNAKDHYFDIYQCLLSSKGKQVKLGEIITDVPQVGNEKTDKGEDKENKFYKQNARKLKHGWCFCFDAEIENDSGVPDTDNLFIPFGGEKSFFKMEVKKQAPVAFSIPENYKRQIPFLLCISDCFVSSDILKTSKLAVNRYVSFRNMKASVENTKKYSGLSENDPQQLTRSSRYNLLQRGSVLYFETKDALAEVKNQIEADDKKHCLNIGFNKTVTR